MSDLKIEASSNCDSGLDPARVKEGYLPPFSLLTRNEFERVTVDSGELALLKISSK